MNINNNDVKNTSELDTKNISDGDFKFVQMDEKIHDVKFETKPTTFFKDALKRFTKNRSSVTAGIIIGVLILMAVIVPIASQSDVINSFPQGSFLPPRWPGMDNINGLNGSKKYENILMDVSDPENPIPAPDKDTGKVIFFTDSIVGEIKTETAFFSTADPYGSDGTLVLRTDKRDKDASFASPYAIFNIENDYQFTMEFDEQTLTAITLPTYSVLMDVKYVFNNDPITISLIDYTNSPADLTSLTVSGFNQTIAENRPLSVASQTIFEARFRLVLKTSIEAVNDGKYPTLFINSFFAQNNDNENDVSLNESGINWTEANELMIRNNNLSLTTQWRNIATSPDKLTSYSGASTIADVKVILGSFHYDEYMHVFGVREMRITKEDFIKNYINTGLVAYDFNIGITSLQILNEDAPVVRVIEQITTQILDKIIIDLIVDMSMYRYYGFDSIPYYLFGTNQRGHDYFKIVFSGLSTSLILGIIVAFVNIFIGIIWGAISGYYGGTIDLAMERITEILSGVPSIVVFTLTILTLGNSFGVFVMAMILTGWIGVAARTRSQFYRYKRREYVLASRTLGAGDGRIIFRHILPNSVGPLITSGVLMIPSIIFTEASIAYLNLGLQGLPSFGVAMSEVQAFIHTDSYLILISAIIVSLLMISFNLFGNGLRDAFNPSLKGVDE